MKNNTLKIGLAGNPNVGKSTVFNALTGMKQHTGNWPGKTVESAIGECECGKNHVEIYDLPGTYSLISHSKEEEVTRDFILNDDYDGIVVVCDAVCLERNLNLVLQVLDVTPDVIVCVNLIDEAEKKKIQIDYEKLSRILKVPVIPLCARKKYGLDQLIDELGNFSTHKYEKKCGKMVNKLNSNKTIEYIKKSEDIANQVVTFNKKDYAEKDRRIDRILTNKATGIPIMLILLVIIFWITIVGANYPTEILYGLFESLGEKLYTLFRFLKVPEYVTGVMLRWRI